MFTVRIGADFNDGNPEGGWWAHQFGKVEGLKFSTSWKGGCLAASFDISVPRRFAHTAVRGGSLVEIFDGGMRVWMGEATEIDRDGWTITADGLFKRAEKCAAVDTSGTLAPTTNILTAATSAAGVGFRWVPHHSLSDYSLWDKSETDQQLNYLVALFEEDALRTGKGFGVDADGRMFEQRPDDDVSWMLTPGVPAMATAEGDYASRVFVRYVSAVTGVPPEPSAWGLSFAVNRALMNDPNYGLADRLEDISSHGLLGSGTSVAQAYIDDLSARPRYSEAVQVAPGQIKTAGGVNPRLSQIQPFHKLRHFGTLTSDGYRGMGQPPEWVIGFVEIDADAGLATVAPVELAPRTMAMSTAAIARIADSKAEIQ